MGCRRTLTRITVLRLARQQPRCSSTALPAIWPLQGSKTTKKKNSKKNKIRRKKSVSSFDLFIERSSKKNSIQFFCYEGKKTGYLPLFFLFFLSFLRNLTSAPKFWKVGGIPLTMQMNVERRKGKDKPVIRKVIANVILLTK